MEKYNPLIVAFYSESFRSNYVVQVYPSRIFIFTGHSLGGAIASLASTQFAYQLYNYNVQVLLITYGQPRTGNYKFATAHDRLVPNSFRLVHRNDLVGTILVLFLLYFIYSDIIK